MDYSYLHDCYSLVKFNSRMIFDIQNESFYINRLGRGCVIKRKKLIHLYFAYAHIRKLINESNLINNFIDLVSFVVVILFIIGNNIL